MHLFFAALLALSLDQRSRIDAVVAQVMRARHIAGLSVGIARDGTRGFLRGYGLRDVARALPADGYTMYPVGSITKQFTAALALQQVAAGRLALDAPVRRYVPALAGDAGRVTIAQLLAQTGGIASDPSAPLAFEPGTGWQYYNANYELLGAVLQAVTGTSYPALLRRAILAPVGLPSTGYGLPANARNVARGYSAQSGWVEVSPDAGNVERAVAASGLISNAPDLLRWLDHLRSGRVVSAPAFALMATSAKLRDGMPANYGFGFFTANWFGYRAIEHPGYVDGFSSEDALVLDDGLEIAVLANREAVDLTPLTKSIVAILDRPLDPNLYATGAQPPQNENPRITADLQTIVRTALFASLGTLASIEFIERSVANGVTYDRYRLTFSAAQWWARVGYRQDGAVESLTLSPVE